MSTKHTETFFQTYDRLSEMGWCDSAGGGEYDRVQAEWEPHGRQYGFDLEGFIHWRANIGPHEGSDDAREAFTDLIAGAPALLVACKMAAAHFSDTDAPIGVELRAAIAAATGEEVTG